MIAVLNLFDLIPGREKEYAKYLRLVQPILDRHKAQVMVYGTTRMTFMGADPQEYCGIIGYPSMRHLRAFSTDPEFEAIRHLRDNSTTNYVLSVIEHAGSLAAAADVLEK